MFLRKIILYFKGALDVSRVAYVPSLIAYCACTPVLIVATATNGFTLHIIWYLQNESKIFTGT